MYWWRNKKLIFSYQSVDTFGLLETVLLSTHSIHFGTEIRKNMLNYTLLSGGLFL